MILRSIALGLAIGAFALGCNKSDDAAKGAPSASAASSAKPAAVASAAKPAPAANLPVKGPWEAVTITFTKLDPKDQSPYFKVTNTGGKTVKVLFMDFYGYDEKGTQVAHNELSYNEDLAGGASDDDVYTHPEPKAKTWEATYHGIEFDGESSPTMDYKRAPAQRPKSGS